MMNVPGLFENRVGERRLEFSAETRSKSLILPKTQKHSPWGSIEFS